MSKSKGVGSGRVRELDDGYVSLSTLTDPLES